MRSKILVTIELMVTLGLTVAAAAALRTWGNQDPTPFDKQIPIAVEQLPQDNGVFPVEVRCGNARLTSPSTIEQFSCIAINNTYKNISALSADLTVITENKDGNESRNTSLLNIDSLVHPDVREARHLKLIPPGESRTLNPPGPISFEDEIISRVEFKIDYVEFEDKTAAGPDRDGSRIINSIREGAARYKAWLVKKYALNKRDMAAIASALEDSDLPHELQFNGDGNLSEGARMYRSVMSSVYANRGAVGLKKFLDKQ
jgi:hypothetical protein